MRELIGIVGCGFVGGAVLNAFKSKFDIIVSDPLQNSISVADVVEKRPAAIFICVPTPKGEDGAVNAGIVNHVLQFIPENQLVILKSTVTPDRIPLDRKNFVYNPEFLTQHNAKQEFLNPPMNVIGGDAESASKVMDLYNKSDVASCPTYITDVATACFVKYTINSFLATKVAFMNEMYMLYHDFVGGDWDRFTDILRNDKRIGSSHLKVPNGGEYGFGGACFPKDTEALLAFANSENADFDILRQVIETNKKIRATWN